MLKLNNNIKVMIIRVNILFCLFTLILFLPFLETYGEEKIKFESMWPTLQQPWYFMYPDAITADNKGFIYVAVDRHIKKFTTEGYFVTEWKLESLESDPNDITVDKDGFIYITYSHFDNNEVLKFSPDGQFINKWDDVGEFAGISSDTDGYIYVVNTFNSQIQKFTSDGQFVLEWGNSYRRPNDVSVDSDGNVYVIETDGFALKYTPDGDYVSGCLLISNYYNNFFYDIAVDYIGYVYVSDHTGYVYRFKTDGEPVISWPACLDDGGSCYIGGITVGKNGSIYVSNKWGYSIRKFTPDGNLLAEWKSNGSKNGYFRSPKGIATDKKGDIYVVDSVSNRIQKFSEDGKFISDWRTYGDEDNVFIYMTDIIIDDNNNFYILQSSYWPWDSYILKFDPTGNHIAKYSIPLLSHAMAVDKEGNIYVPNYRFGFITIYNSDGQYVSQWGERGDGDGQFDMPENITFDADGNIYVSDSGNSRIQKFTKDLQFLRKWGKAGTDNGEFSSSVPGITVDDSGFVCALDAGNNRVQKFTKDGEFIESFGSYGLNPGQFNSPYDLCIGRNGKIYVNRAF